MNMFKIALAGTALVGSLATAVANNTCSFSGFYAGGQIGVGTTKSQVSTSATSKVPLSANGQADARLGRIVRPGTDNHSSSSSLAGTGAIGGLHVGYGKHFPNRFYLGFEAYANLSKNRAKSESASGYTMEAVSERNNPNNGQPAYQNPGLLSSSDVYSGYVKAERKNSFGLALRPGMVFGNTLVNLILGVESTKFNYITNAKLTSNPFYYDAAGNPNIESFPTDLGTIKKSKRVYGFVPGLEVSFMANDHVMIGLKATHTMYRKTNLKSQYENIAVNKKVKNQATDIVAKVSYKF